MAAKPFPTRLVIDRLTSTIPRTELEQVNSAAQYASIEKLSDFRALTTFVLLANERWDGEPPKAGRQRMIVNFGVVTAVKNFRDTRKGVESAEELDPLIERIRQQLIGWKPALEGSRECALIDGNVLDFDANVLLWIDVYQTQHFIGGGA
jgi:hypothetical protein